MNRGRSRRSSLSGSGVGALVVIAGLCVGQHRWRVLQWLRGLTRTWGGRSSASNFTDEAERRRERPALRGALANFAGGEDRSTVRPRPSGKPLHSLTTANSPTCAVLSAGQRLRQRGLGNRAVHAARGRAPAGEGVLRWFSHREPQRGRLLLPARRLAAYHAVAPALAGAVHRGTARAGRCPVLLGRGLHTLAKWRYTL
jgi:hypothetical protein